MNNSVKINQINPINSVMKIIREMHDLDIRELADELQLDYEDIYSVEDGDAKVTDNLIHLYAVFFKIPKEAITFFCNERNEGRITKPFRDKVASMAVSFLEKYNSK